MFQLHHRDQLLLLLRNYRTLGIDVKMLYVRVYLFFYYYY